MSADVDQLKQQIMELQSQQAFQEDALRSGITGVHTCETLTEWEALAALEVEGKLKLRVYHLLPPDDLEKVADLGITAGNGSHRLWFKHARW